MSTAQGKWTVHKHAGVTTDMSTDNQGLSSVKAARQCQLLTACQSLKSQWHRMPRSEISVTQNDTVWNLCDAEYHRLNHSDTECQGLKYQWHRMTQSEITVTQNDTVWNLSDTECHSLKSLTRHAIIWNPWRRMPVWINSLWHGMTQSETTVSYYTDKVMTRHARVWVKDQWTTDGAHDTACGSLKQTTVTRHAAVWNQSGSQLHDDLHLVLFLVLILKVVALRLGGRVHAHLSASPGNRVSVSLLLFKIDFCWPLLLLPLLSDWC